MDLLPKDVFIKFEGIHSSLSSELRLTIMRTLFCCKYSEFKNNAGKINQ